jgi:large subunit ribosomal protein L13
MTLSQKTTVAKPNELPKKWFHVDAEGQVLGRLASDIAVILMGKHRPTYTPHVDTGDYVVVTNADKIVMTGQKFQHRHFAWYTGYTGQKMESYGERLERRPEDLIIHAVRRMLPKNKLATHMLGKLKVYAGSEHPHQAQQVEKLDHVGKKTFR